MRTERASRRSRSFAPLLAVAVFATVVAIVFDGARPADSAGPGDPGTHSGSPTAAAALPRTPSPDLVSVLPHEGEHSEPSREELAASVPVSKDRAIAVDLTVECDRLGDDLRWVRAADVVLVRGAEVTARGDAWKPAEWVSDSGLDKAHLSDFLTLALPTTCDEGGSTIHIAVLLALAPTGPKLEVEPGVIQVVAGEVSVEIKDLLALDRLDISLNRGEHDVLLTIPPSDDPELVGFELVHADSRRGLGAADADALFGERWPSNPAFDESPRAGFDHGSLSDAAVSFLSRPGDDDAVTVLGVPCGWLMSGRAPRVGPEGERRGIYHVVASAPGRIRTTRDEPEAIVIGAAQSIDFEILRPPIPQLNLSWEPGLERTPVTVEISVEEVGKRARALYAGVVGESGGPILWCAVGPVDDITRASCVLKASGRGLVDVACPIILSSTRPVEVKLRRDASPWSAEIEIVGVDVGLPVPIRYGCQWTSDQPMVSDEAWVDASRPLRFSLAGRPGPRRFGATLIGARVDSTELRRALGAAWRSSELPGRFSGSVLIERDFTTQALLPTGGTLDDRDRCVRHREHIRIIILEGRSRWTLPGFVDAHGLRSAFLAEVAAADPANVNFPSASNPSPAHDKEPK